jgi:hypothetical protein
LDDAAIHETQYRVDQLNSQNACWPLYHDNNYQARMRARDFQVAGLVKALRAAAGCPIYFAQVDRFLRSLRKDPNA